MKNTAKALRDPKTRNDEIKFISDYPISFAMCLEETADYIEKILDSEIK